MESALPHNAYVTQENGYLRLYLPKQKPMVVLVNAARDTVALARSLHLFYVLVDATDYMSQQPSLFEMFQMVVQAAAITDPRLKIVVVDGTRSLLKDNFVLTAARNRGMFLAIFDNPAEALAWMLPDR